MKIEIYIVTLYCEEGALKDFVTWHTNRVYIEIG